MLGHPFSKLRPVNIQTSSLRPLEYPIEIGKGSLEIPNFSQSHNPLDITHTISGKAQCLACAMTYNAVQNKKENVNLTLPEELKIFSVCIRIK